MNQPLISPPRLFVLAAACCAIAGGAGCRMVSTGRNVDGVRHVQMGQLPVAMQRFEAAITIDPRNPDSYYNLGAVRHRAGLATRDQNSLTQAESLYQQCLALDPNHTDAYRGLAVLLTETGRTADAFNLLNRWAVSSPQNAEARVELARLHEEYNQPVEAERALNQALAIDVRNWRALAALGRLREQQGDYAQALQNYQTAYAYNRFQPELPAKIASLQSRVSPLQQGAAPLVNPALGNRSATSPTPFRSF